MYSKPNEGEFDSNVATISLSISDAENLLIVSTPEPVYVGEVAEITLTLKGSGIYGMQLLLNLMTASNPLSINFAGTYGNVFDPSSRLVIPGLVSNNSWFGAISLREPAEPVNGEGVFVTIPVVATERCKLTLDQNWFDIILADKQSNDLPITVVPGTIEFIDNVVTCELGAKYANLYVTLLKNDITVKTVQLDSNGNGSFGNINDGSYTLKIDNFQPVAIEMQNSSFNVSCSDIFYTSDINLDGVVDVADSTIVGGSFNLSKGDTHYNEKADLTDDGKVNIKDLIQIGAQFNYSSCSE